MCECQVGVSRRVCVCVCVCVCVLWERKKKEGRSCVVVVDDGLDIHFSLSRASLIHAKAATSGKHASAL